MDVIIFPCLNPHVGPAKFCVQQGTLMAICLSPHHGLAQLQDLILV